MAGTVWYLAQCNLGRNENERAIELLERAESIYVESWGADAVEVVFVQAEIAALKGQRDRALGLLQRAWELGLDERLGLVVTDAYGV